MPTQNCSTCLFSDPEQVVNLVADVAAIRTHVENYLGNGKDGSVPTDIKEIKSVLTEHTEYINRQKGSNSTWKTIRTVALTILVAAIGWGVTLLAKVHK